MISVSVRDERSPLWGWEWDFLAVDEVGSVALLWSAGYGPIPRDVLDNRPVVESAVADLVRSACSSELMRG